MHYILFSVRVGLFCEGTWFAVLEANAMKRERGLITRLARELSPLLSATSLCSLGRVRNNKQLLVLTCDLQREREEGSTALDFSVYREEMIKGESIGGSEL